MSILLYQMFERSFMWLLHDLGYLSIY